MLAKSAAGFERFDLLRGEDSLDAEVLAEVDARRARNLTKCFMRPFSPNLFICADPGLP